MMSLPRYGQIVIPPIWFLYYAVIPCPLSNRSVQRREQNLHSQANRKVPATMSDERFADYIARERERLSRERDEISNQRRELDNRLAKIDREFQALEAYQSAKTGKPSGAHRMRT